MMSSRSDTTAPEPSGPFSLNEVLAEELEALRPGLLRDLPPTPFPASENPRDNEPQRAANLSEIYDHIRALPGDRRLSALCLSGGGIRSATFNLGVIQALTRLGIITKLDYLSTVSGGGYIGGWLEAWMHRVGAANVLADLSRQKPEQPLKPEPRPVDRLREYSNYLTPRKGLVSGDTWAVAAIVIRNLLLNWLVVVPVLMLFVAWPQLFELAVRMTDDLDWARVAIAIASLLALLASWHVHRIRGRDREGLVASGLDRGAGVHRRIVRFGIVPLVLAMIVLALGVAWLPPADLRSGTVAIFAMVWCIAIPLLGWLIGELPVALKVGRKAREANAAKVASATPGPGLFPWGEFGALVLSGTIAAGLLFVLATTVYPRLVGRPVVYSTTAVPLLIAVYLISRTVLVALTDWFTQNTTTPGIVGRDDSDREWWARFSGILLLMALAWALVCVVSLVGWILAARVFKQYAGRAVASLGGVAGLIAVVIGKSGKTGSGREGGQGSAGQPGVRKTSILPGIALAVAAPLFCLAVFVLLAHAYTLLATLVASAAAVWLESSFGVVVVPPTMTDASGANVLLFALPMPVLWLLAWVASKAVNVNRFSLHGMYRNRLVRAYLGASNDKREESLDPFTGFAKNDNLAMHELWHPRTLEVSAEPQQPLLVVNTTLNLVRGERLGWQERKAESFSMSPLFCGNFYEGYRRSTEYGGRNGITLGTALTISGAAANPNMGYHSSPPVTFLLGLLNARLGAWLGNTNQKGNETFRYQGPRSALVPLFAELFGRTDAKNEYIQLSDGGHFDNLGLYEMVLRRCRFIIVSDAGMDRGPSFGDLGNAIRKIRIDFGIPIVFNERIAIVSRDDTNPGMLCAMGTVQYSRADGGSSASDGTLIYLKPTLNLAGKGQPIPYDVFSYQKTAADFPHESTVDQWFDESQFESYRALGEYLVDRITERLPVDPLERRKTTLGEFERAVEESLGRVQAAAAQDSGTTIQQMADSLGAAFSAPRTQ